MQADSRNGIAAACVRAAVPIGQDRMQGHFQGFKAGQLEVFSMRADDRQ